jgi:peptidoglycan hydrolase-like protein with peptidoglycan-binding domain
VRDGSRHQRTLVAADEQWEEERRVLQLGRVWQIFLRRPRDSVLAVVAALAVLAVFINGLFLQPGPHPAPIFQIKPLPVASGDATGALAGAAPKPRPAAADPGRPDVLVSPRPRTDIVADVQRELSRRGFYDGGVDGVYGARTDAAIRDFEQAAGRKASVDVNEALLLAIQRSPLKAQGGATAGRNDPIAGLIGPSKTVLAVQRALNDFGYGRIKPTGRFDMETKLAIERFERERKLPVTGDISERVVRELAVRTGRPLE